MKQVLKINATWARVKSTLRNEQLLAIDVKGGGKSSNRRKGPKKEKRGILLPSMPKGETVGNVVIDGKGGSRGRDRRKFYREHAKNRRKVYL